MVLLLAAVLIAVSSCLQDSSINLREETTPYECGFEHHSLARVPFSLRYFFLTLVFLLFDLEIVLLVFVSQVRLSSFSHLAELVVLVFV